MAELFTLLGKASMRLSVSGGQLVDDVSWTVLNFDTIVVERGGITGSSINNSITVSKDGLYEFIVGIDVEMPGTEELLMMAYINGVAYSGLPLAIQGAGAGKPVNASWESTSPLVAGDVIDIRLQNGDAGSFTATMRRLYFALKSDS